MGKVKMKSMLDEKIGFYNVIVAVTPEETTTLTYPYIILEERDSEYVLEDAEGYHTRLPKALASRIAVDIEELPSFYAYLWVRNREEIDQAEKEGLQAIEKYMSLMRQAIEKTGIRLKSTEDAKKIKQWIREAKASEGRATH